MLRHRLLLVCGTLLLPLALTGCPRGQPDIAVVGTPPPPPAADGSDDSEATRSDDGSEPVLPAHLERSARASSGLHDGHDHGGPGGELPQGHPPLEGEQGRMGSGGEGEGPSLPPGHPPTDGEASPSSRQGGALPPGHPPTEGREIESHGGPDGGSRQAGPMMGSSPDEADLDDHELPVEREGIGSVEELRRVAAGLDDPEAREAFEEAFRRAFTPESTGQDLRRAHAILEELRREHPGFGGTWRVLGKVLLESGQFGPSLEAYRRAVEANPDYGEAHYAISFFLGAQGQRAEGRRHFERAMELGVPDERGLGPRFFPEASGTR